MSASSAPALHTPGSSHAAAKVNIFRARTAHFWKLNNRKDRKRQPHTGANVNHRQALPPYQLCTSESSTESIAQVNQKSQLLSVSSLRTSSRDTHAHMT
eukprot:3621199-Rhodomonas_salina.1